ncbi:MAG TPA: hypothetical protein PLY88_00070 [Candidatus Omnitrophota bacterium]|nr:hypothetical protein [Candidatus Omnitrophota bacterium]
MKFLLFLVLVSAVGCAGVKGPALLKYESAVANIDQRAARGEISSMESDNLKLQTQQQYLMEKRLEERMLSDESDRQIQSQNQDVNAAYLTR